MSKDWARIVLASDENEDKLVAVAGKNNWGLRKSGGVGMKHCAKVLLVGLDGELPTDRTIAYEGGAPPFIGCNHLVCQKCGADVRHVDHRSTASHFPPGRDVLEELYASSDPASSPHLTSGPAWEKSRVYFCRCDWAPCDLEVRFVAMTDSPWFCGGHGEDERTEDSEEEHTVRDTRRRLGNGRFVVSEPIDRYEYAMAVALARDSTTGQMVRLTTAAWVAGTADELRPKLARDIPGLAPVVYLGDVASDNGDGSSCMMMAEAFPEGSKELTLPSGLENARELAAVGARLAGHVLRVHRAGMVLATLRPESIFVDPAGELVLLVRGERLWLMPRQDVMKGAVVPPWRLMYYAPETHKMSPMLADPPPVADVFSIGMILASALLGECVYRFEYFMQMIVKQHQGEHEPLPETPLGRLLTRCLLPEPTARPSLEELERGLLRQPD